MAGPVDASFIPRFVRAAGSLSPSRRHFASVPGGPIGGRLRVAVVPPAEALADRAFAAVFIGNLFGPVERTGGIIGEGRPAQAADRAVASRAFGLF